MAKFETLKKMETLDYQNRRDYYPEKNVADSIVVSDMNGKAWIVVDFKNTEEEEAKRWTRLWLQMKNLSHDVLSVSSHQTGDYHNDWVSVKVVIKLD